MRSTAASPLARARTALAQAQEQASARWSRLAEREQRLLTLAGAALGLLLTYTVLIAPAQRTLRNVPVQLEAVERQLQTMQAQAAEARLLAASPSVPAADAQAALSGATDRLGPKAQLHMRGEHAVLMLSGVPSEALQAWLGEVRAAARARPVEAQLTRSPQGFTGSIVLSLGGGA
ncbi:type II secretion system protein GspM [Roseateles paludis]|uniref:Type II secretion system protein GspM n=1 Tax=Roseateles paludis TaxID=3145238 RepID=A0ABV0G4K5_9BURK